jgi:hypothetical protein
MRIFRRKSPWQRALESVAAVSTARPVRRTAKVTAGVASAAATLTALSAAVSSARHGDRK